MLRAPFLLLVLLLLAAVPGHARAAATPADPNPFAGQQLFNDCEAGLETSARSYSPWYWANHTSGAKRTLIRRIARVPQAKWFAGNSVRPTPRKLLVRYLARVDDPRYGGPNCRSGLPEGARGAYPGRYPVLVVRAMKHEACKGYDGGVWGKAGPRSAYRHWIDSFVTWLRLTWTGPVRYTYRDAFFPRAYFSPFPRQAAVILEPDALGVMGKLSGCLTGAARKRRLANFAYATRQLAALGPAVATYVDAGASDWLKPAEAVRLLRAAGVANVRGFALNSTHFNATGRELAYGNRIARALGGAHFVVNTAENGRGALPRRSWGRAKFKSKWCNPANAGLGTLPTTRTGSPYADAFLWISRPGLSTNVPNGRGACGTGPLKNVWWEQRALAEARRARQPTVPWPSVPLETPAVSSRR